MLKILHGDCRQTLKELPDGSVNTCVTSPPYFGLRSYLKDDDPNKPLEIGLERTPDEYVASIVSVMREVRRVLRDDGTLWLNLGDSYAHSMRQSGKAHAGKKQNTSEGSIREGFAPCPTGYKEKDLMGIPWRVAFALQADGWYLRQDIIEEVELYCPCGCGYVLEERIWRHSQDREIIWRKPNPMPESVTDRCTKSHEYIFLLSKSERYYFDQEAVKVPVKADWGIRDRSNGKYHNEGTGLQPHSGLSASYEMANRRSVWTVPTSPFSGAHFATFPPELIRPCVLAGCPVGGTVLDPFGGSGTTGKVALELGRQAILCELNAEYLPLIEHRTTVTLGLPFAA